MAVQPATDRLTLLSRLVVWRACGRTGPSDGRGLLLKEVRERWGGGGAARRAGMPSLTDLRGWRGGVSQSTEEVEQRIEEEAAAVKGMRC